MMEMPTVYVLSRRFVMRDGMYWHRIHSIWNCELGAKDMKASLDDTYPDDELVINSYTVKGGKRLSEGTAESWPKKKISDFVD